MIDLYIKLYQYTTVYVYLILQNPNTFSILVRFGFIGSALPANDPNFTGYLNNDHSTY